METLWQDVKYGVRMLARSPGFVLVALAALALGMGANTAIFTVVNAVLLRPLPYAEPERLVLLWEQAPVMETSVAYPNFLDLKEHQRSFERFAGFRRESFNLTGAGEAERLSGRMVSADFFSTFGVPLEHGRDFTPDDDRQGAEPVVVLGYDFWRRRFGQDDRLVGRKITLNDRVFTVVGITGRGFRFGSGDVYAPLGLWAERYQDRGSHPGLYIVGRLRPGTSRERAGADLDAIFATLGKQYPKTNGGRRTHLESLFENTVGEVRTSLYILLGAVGFVLLIACANVANLLLARAAARSREIAIRTALGAGRMRIVRLLLTESLLLSLAGGALGVLLAFWGTDLLLSAVPAGIPRLEEVGVDFRVLAFSLALSMLTGIVFGLAPALAISKPDAHEGLKEGERGSTGRGRRLRSALVVAEVGISLVLLVGAGLMVRSISILARAPLGFDAHDVLTVQLSMTVPREEGARAARFVEQVESALRALPGVRSAAVSSGVPFAGASEDSFYLAKEKIGEPGDEKMAVSYVTTPGYRETLGLTLLRGRYFTEQDRADSVPVAVVDQSFVDRYLEGVDPIGRALYNEADQPGAEIVGVVGHVQHYGINGEVPVEPQVYTPIAQASANAMPFVARNLTLLVRSSTAPSTLLPALRERVRALDAAQPVFNVRTMDEIVALSLAGRRFAMFLLAAFSGLALVLSGVGIYGVMTYSITQRTQEVGIRMALGARGRDVLLMVVRHGMLLTALGVAAGTVMALFLTRVLGSLLYGVTASDPTTFAGVTVLLAAVALLACLVPAVRATRVDPMRALRQG